MEYMKTFWECFVTIMAEEPMEERYDHVYFGCFENHIDLINDEYANICARISRFIRETGMDPYGRKANGESLLHYALMNRIWHRDVETIYRMYVDDKVSMTMPDPIIHEFTLID